MNIEEGLNMNNINKQDAEISKETSLPVSADKYKETLKSLSREDIIAGLTANGASQEEAEELANEFDQDR